MYQGLVYSGRHRVPEIEIYVQNMDVIGKDWDLIQVELEFWGQSLQKNWTILRKVYMLMQVRNFSNLICIEKIWGKYFYRSKPRFSIVMVRQREDPRFFNLHLDPATLQCQPCTPRRTITYFAGSIYYHSNIDIDMRSLLSVGYESTQLSMVKSECNLCEW